MAHFDPNNEEWSVIEPLLPSDSHGPKYKDDRKMLDQLSPHTSKIDHIDRLLRLLLAKSQLQVFYANYGYEDQLYSLICQEIQLFCHAVNHQQNRTKHLFPEEKEVCCIHLYEPQTLIEACRL